MALLLLIVASASAEPPLTNADIRIPPSSPNSVTENPVTYCQSVARRDQSMRGQLVRLLGG
jgi:hypothetical protein